MRIEPFLLDRWLQDHSGASIRFDFGSSTGPHWTLREVLALGHGRVIDRLLDLELVYSKTSGADGLRHAIAEMAGVPDDQVIVMTGAAEPLTHLFFLAAEPGANVIVPFPCFPPHRAIPSSLGLEVRTYRLDRDKGYRIDIDEVKRLVDDKTKVLLVNVPHNPTGAVLTDDELQSLHDFSVERGVQFVCDEVHGPVFHGSKTASASRLPHATSIGDFSKAFSLPGLRLGWMIEPDPRRRAEYLNSREYVTISNSPVTEFVGEIAVRRRDVLRGRTQDVAEKNLRILDRLFAENSNALRWVRPQGGMTGFPWFLDGRSAREFCEVAAAKGILLVPGDCMGAPDHFRIGFGVREEGFDRSVE